MRKRCFLIERDADGKARVVHRSMLSAAELDEARRDPLLAKHGREWLAAAEAEAALSARFPATGATPGAQHPPLPGSVAQAPPPAMPAHAG